MFHVVFSTFFTIPVDIENQNARLKFALAIPAGAPVRVANDAIEMLPHVADKRIKDISKYQKKQYTYLAFYSLILFL